MPDLIRYPNALMPGPSRPGHLFYSSKSS